MLFLPKNSSFFISPYVTQSCLTLCDPMDYGPPGSSFHEFLQARNTAVGSYFILREIFRIQGSNPGLLRCRQILYLALSQHQSQSLKAVGYMILFIWYSCQDKTLGTALPLAEGRGPGVAWNWWSWWPFMPWWWWQLFRCLYLWKLTWKCALKRVNYTLCNVHLHFFFYWRKTIPLLAVQWSR